MTAKPIRATKAAPAPDGTPQVEWTILHVEDDAQTRKDVREALEGIKLPGGRIRIVAADRLADPLTLLAARSADLIILDIKQGEGAGGGDPDAGLALFEQERQKGWGPIVIHSASGDKFQKFEGEPLTRVVTKGKPGVSAGTVAKAVEDMFHAGGPLHKHAITSHLQDVVHATLFEGDKHDFLEISKAGQKGAAVRVLARRVAASFAGRAGLRSLSGLVGDPLPGDHGDDIMTPEETYVRPPIEPEFLTGDMLKGPAGQVAVILTASCDLPFRRDGKPNIENVLLAPADEWPSPSATSRLEKINETKEETRRNSDAERYGQNVARRYGAAHEYFLPGAFGDPDRLVEFRRTFIVAPEELKEDWNRIQSLDENFRADLAQRYASWLSRIGTDRLSVEGYGIKAANAAKDLLRKREAAPKTK